MNEVAYIKEMKELGWTNEHIDNQIKIHDEAIENGIEIPYKIDLIEAPINF